MYFCFLSHFTLFQFVLISLSFFFIMFFLFQDLYCVRSDLGNLLKALGRLDEAKVCGFSYALRRAILRLTFCFHQVNSEARTSSSSSLFRIYHRWMHFSLSSHPCAFIPIPCCPPPPLPLPLHPHVTNLFLICDTEGSLLNLDLVSW